MCLLNELIGKGKFETMSEGSGNSTVFQTQAMQALGLVLESGVIGERSRLRQLLRFLVEEELEGRDESLSAYSIGVDVLRRSEDFDPNEDSIVRVEMNRLRQAVAGYYEGVGAEDRLWIDIPRGSYRVNFELRQPETEPETGDGAKPEPIEASVEAQRPRPRRTGIAAAVVALAAAAAAAFFLMIEAPKEQEPAFGPPLIEVGPIRNLIAGAAFAHLGDGVRARIISDLSHFRTLRVRDAVRQTEDSGALKPADFYLSGHLLRPGDAAKLHLVLSDKKTSEVIWSTNRDLPSGQAQLHEVYLDTVRAVAAELASTSGALVAEALRRFDSHSDPERQETLYEFACVLRWHAFDVAKRTSDEARARACVERHVADGSSSGSIWAAYAFMKFLDWTRQPDLNDRRVLDQALEAADRAVRLDPTGAAGHEYRGSVLLALGRYEAAAEAYAAALDFNRSKPDIAVSSGWTEILRSGDWERGVELVEEGIALSPAPPGWFRIPLAIDAYRREHWEQSLEQAEAILHAGDIRGAPLALAAAYRIGDRAHMNAFLSLALQLGEDPMSPIEAIFNKPEVMERYQADIAAAAAPP